MAAVQPTNKPTRHVFGDCVVRFYNITASDGDTLTVGQSQILFIIVSTQVINLDVATTIVGNVITILANAPFTGTMMVVSREG